MSRSFLVVLVAAVAALGLLVGPALPSLGDRFLGVEYTDHYGTQWFYWFADQVLRHGQSPLWTDHQFHPFGKDLYRHTGTNLLDALLAVPLRTLLGPVLGYNLFVVLGMLASGLAFHRLAKVFTTDRVATGIGAVLFACSPFLLYELREGRPTQALLVTLPLFLRHAWLTSQEPGWRHPLLGGLWLFLTGLTYWFYAFFGGMAVLGLGLLRAVNSDAPAKVFYRYAALAGVAVGACLPLALPLILETARAGPEVPGLLDPSSWTWFQLTSVTETGEPVGLFSWQPLTGQTGLLTTQGLQEVFLPCHELLSPAALLAVALWAWCPGPLDRQGWAALVLPCALFAAGPLLIAGHSYVINPWWGAWTGMLPFLRRLWWPSRAFVIPTVGIALCMVIVLARIGQRSFRAQVLATVALGGLWAHHLIKQDLAPFPSWDAAIPAGYRCLASGGEEALIELPYSWTQGHLYYQTHHGRPVLGGMLENNEAFTPPESVALRTENSFLQAILGVSDLQGEVPGWTTEDRLALRKIGFAFVVFQKDAFVDPGSPNQGKGATARRAHLRRTQAHLAELLGPPIYNDARIILYAPWGDPLPCDPATLPPDDSPGVGEVLRHTILDLPEKNRVIQSPFVR